MTTATKNRENRLFLPWIIWVIAASYFLFDYVQQMAPGIMGPELIEHFSANDAVLGTLSAFYFYSYAVMQIPVGIITDHFGPHRPLVIAVLVATGGSILFSMSGAMMPLLVHAWISLPVRSPPIFCAVVLTQPESSMMRD